MKNEKGIALILVLFTMLFISLLVVAFVDLATIDQQIVTNQVRDLQAGFISDAGVETAVYELRQDSGYSGTGGNVEFPSGSGNTYNVAVSGSTITSTGTVSDFSRTIEVDFSISGASALYTVRINTWKEI
jgi:type II secretory pathway component PulK